MKILTIALADLKMAARNIVSFSLILIMPVIMVLVMGSVMKDVFEPEPFVGGFEVPYINESSEEKALFMENYMIEKSEGVLEFKRVEKNEEKAALIISGSGDRYDIRIVSNNLNVKEGIFLEIFMTNMAREAKNLLLDMPESGRYIEISQYRNPHIPDLNGYQFFSATMMIFFLLTSGMGIGGTLIDERKNLTYSRIRTYPLTAGTYLAGKIISAFATGIFQAVGIILITRNVFKVDWGSNMPSLAVIVILLISISCTLGILFSNFFNSSGSLVASMTVFLWFMTFVSGGFTVEPVLGKLPEFTVNYWAFKGISKIMINRNDAFAVKELLVLTSVALVLWMGAVLMYKRGEKHEYAVNSK